MSGAEGVNHREEGIPLTPTASTTAATMVGTTTTPATNRTRRLATAAPSADLGMAAEGERYSVEDEAENATAAAEQEGEPDDGIPDNDDDGTDADAVRAAVMRKARLQARRAAAASASRGLPMIPGSAQPASSSSSASGGARTRGPRRRELSGFAYWWLCCRVCMRWRVLKHVLMLLALPTLFLLAGVYYFRFMPTSGLSFPAALVRGDAATVRYYLDWGGAALDHPLPADEQRRAPIHLAALGNHTEVVRMLVDRGAALDARDGQGLTPLHYAAHVGSFDMVQLLLERGADVEARDDNMRTPLHLAAIVGSVPVLALLVFEGQADLRASDSDAYLATDYARLFHTDNLQKLLDDGYYYHPEDGRMKVIAQGEFQRVREREARPWGEQRRIEGGSGRGRGGRGGGEKPAAGAAAPSRPKEKAQSKSRKKALAKATTEAKLKAEEERKQRKRQRRTGGGVAGTAPPAPQPAADAKSAPVASASAPSSSSVVDEDAELMALFTGDEGAHRADVARYKRSADEEAQQREAAAEYSRMLQQGAVDQDEFDL